MNMSASAPSHDSSSYPPPEAVTIDEGEGRITMIREKENQAPGPRNNKKSTRLGESNTTNDRTQERQPKQPEASQHMGTTQTTPH
jgi:hypothetical protein